MLHSSFPVSVVPFQRQHQVFCSVKPVRERSIRQMWHLAFQLPVLFVCLERYTHAPPSPYSPTLPLPSAMNSAGFSQFTTQETNNCAALLSRILLRDRSPLIWFTDVIFPKWPTCFRTDTFRNGWYNISVAQPQSVQHRFTRSSSYSRI